MDNKSYFRALGCLAYAVAMADGKIQTGERAKVFQFVISMLASHEEADATPAYALGAFYLEREFHRLGEKKLTADQACELFLSFFDAHKNDFDQDRKNTCLQVMKNVAGADREIGEHENQMIGKIMNRINESDGNN